MTENIILIGLGVCFIVLGIFNCFGHIETIHWYNRKKITEETRKPYGKKIGLGTIIIGASMILFGALELIVESNAVYIGLLIGCVAGLAIILYGQIKYNRGIF